jgi:hypothetical protein
LFTTFLNKQYNFAKQHAVEAKYAARGGDRDKAIQLLGLAGASIMLGSMYVHYITEAYMFMLRGFKKREEEKTVFEHGMGGVFNALNSVYFVGPTSEMMFYAFAEREKFMKSRSPRASTLPIRMGEFAWRAARDTTRLLEQKEIQQGKRKGKKPGFPEIHDAADQLIRLAGLFGGAPINTPLNIVMAVRRGIQEHMIEPTEDFFTTAMRRATMQNKVGSHAEIREKEEELLRYLQLFKDADYKLSTMLRYVDKMKSTHVMGRRRVTKRLGIDAMRRRKRILIDRWNRLD